MFPLLGYLTGKYSELEMGSIWGGLRPQPYYLGACHGTKKNPSPLKFNFSLLEDQTYLEAIKENQSPFNPSPPKSPSIQFLSNIKREK
jgi:hypothetical protein